MEYMECTREKLTSWVFCLTSDRGSWAVCWSSHNLNEPCVMEKGAAAQQASFSASFPGLLSGWLYRPRLQACGNLQAVNLWMFISFICWQACASWLQSLTASHLPLVTITIHNTTNHYTILHYYSIDYITLYHTILHYVTLIMLHYVPRCGTKDNPTETKLIGTYRLVWNGIYK